MIAEYLNKNEGSMREMGKMKYANMQPAHTFGPKGQKKSKIMGALYRIQRNISEVTEGSTIEALRMKYSELRQLGYTHKIIAQCVHRIRERQIAKDMEVQIWDVAITILGLEQPKHRGWGKLK